MPALNWLQMIFEKTIPIKLLRFAGGTNKVSGIIKGSFYLQLKTKI